MRAFLLAMLIPSLFTTARGQGPEHVLDTVTDTVAHVQEQPVYPGGMERLYVFLRKNTKYPKQARKEGIGGRVYVEFVVDRTGDVRDVKVLRGVHPLLDAEAARAVARMPRWEPGYMDGVPVNCRYTVPVNFKPGR